MFGNKKNISLPPRPNQPSAEQILEDILNADKDDVVFDRNVKRDESKIVNDNWQQQQQQQQQQQRRDEESAFENGDTETVYKTLKSYLTTREILNELNDTLKTEYVSLIESDSEMKRMAEDIRKQAQDALSS